MESQHSKIESRITNNSRFDIEIFTTQRFNSKFDIHFLGYPIKALLLFYRIKSSTSLYIHILSNWINAFPDSFYHSFTLYVHLSQYVHVISCPSQRLLIILAIPSEYLLVLSIPLHAHFKPRAEPEMWYFKITFLPST